MKTANNFNRRILLSVTGMSPAVVMETLYALVTEKNFIPTEIRLITTLQGKNKIMKSLLGIEGGRVIGIGALNEFIQDYGKKYGFSDIYFDESCISVIKNKEGKELSDIQSPEENEIASDQIVSLVGNLCQDDESAIHVSIAGGRKTMGFFLGYALSLYGREQDRLSHVLVSPDFESLDNFYYPKPYSHPIFNRKGEEIDASNAQVMLAEIPWVRLGLSGISEKLLENKVSYSESIANAQSILDRPFLKFLTPIDDRKIQCGTKIIKFSPRGYTLMLSLAIASSKNLIFKLHNEEVSKLYIAIYDLVKGDITGKIAKRFNEDPDKLLSESRNDINKKIRYAFSLAKDTEIAYIPSSKNYEYKLDIDDIDISEIQREIEKLLM